MGLGRLPSIQTLFAENLYHFLNIRIWTSFFLKINLSFFVHCSLDASMFEILRINQPGNTILNLWACINQVSIHWDGIEHSLGVWGKNWIWIRFQLYHSQYNAPPIQCIAILWGGFHFCTRLHCITSILETKMLFLRLCKKHILWTFMDFKFDSHNLLSSNLIVSHEFSYLRLAKP